MDALQPRTERPGLGALETETMTKLTLNEDHLATISNALRIASRECARDAENPCATPAESEAFAESSKEYAKLADKIDEAEEIKVSID